MIGRFTKKKRKIVIVLILACASLWMGCLGRSPNVRHFTLGTQHELVPAQRAPQLAVLIGPVRLPDYLDRTQIVRRTGSGEIKLDEFNRWLGGFESVLTTALATEVRRQLGSVRVVGYPSQAPFKTDYSVRIHVDDWVVDASSMLIVRLRWAIEGARGNAGAPLLSTHESKIPVQRGSVEAIVDAHDRAIAELAGKLADDLVTASARPPAPDDEIDGR